MKTPYDIIKNRHVTEKAKVLEGLCSDKPEGKKKGSVSSCHKYVFKVHPKANKIEIIKAIEAIYKEDRVKVRKVNTIVLKPKSKKMGKGRPGHTATVKKAIVTLSFGSSLI